MTASDALPDAIDADPDQARSVLLGQLRYLIDEIETLKPLAERIPEAVQTGRPTPDALSLKEIYGAIALRDEQVRQPRVQRMAEADTATPRFDPVDDADLVAAVDWNARPLPDILERVQAARAALVEQLDTLPPAAWAHEGQLGDETLTVYAMVHRIVREDTDRLRDLGYRLHEANLTDRERDLPK